MAALADPTASSGSCLVEGVSLLTPQLIADPKWGEEEIAPPGPREYSDMCREVYEEFGDERAQKAAELAEMEGGECMLYMNFKSHAIFGEEQVTYGVRHSTRAHEKNSAYRITSDQQLPRSSSGNTTRTLHPFVLFCTH